MMSDHVISTRLVFSNAQSHTITTHAHGSPTVSDLLAGPTRERPVENNQHQCPCAMPIVYMQRYTPTRNTRVMLPLRLRHHDHSRFTVDSRGGGRFVNRIHARISSVFNRAVWTQMKISAASAADCSAASRPAAGSP
jgi:hypothetical protein